MTFRFGNAIEIWLVDSCSPKVRELNMVEEL